MTIGSRERIIVFVEDNALCRPGSLLIAAKREFHNVCTIPSRLSSLRNLYAMEGVYEVVTHRWHVNVVRVGNTLTFLARAG